MKTQPQTKFLAYAGTLPVGVGIEAYTAAARVNSASQAGKQGGETMTQLLHSFSASVRGGFDSHQMYAYLLAAIDKISHHKITLAVLLLVCNAALTFACHAFRRIFLMQALEGARQKDDNIKDEIWHELAQVQYLCWEQESAAALQKQQLLQGRMHHLLQQQRDHELAAQVASIADWLQIWTYLLFSFRNSQERLLHDVKHVKIWCHGSF